MSKTAQLLTKTRQALLIYPTALIKQQTGATEEDIRDYLAGREIDSNVVHFGLTDLLNQARKLQTQQWQKQKGIMH